MMMLLYWRTSIMIICVVFQNLRSSYGALLQELKKMEETSGKSETGSSEASLDKILSHLSGQLGHFLTARAKTMDLYPFLIDKRELVIYFCFTPILNNFISLLFCTQPKRLDQGCMVSKSATKIRF